MAWILLAWTCAFAAPVELPAGEDPATWVNPLALAGLGPGQIEPSAEVRFTSAGAGWTLWVRDVEGGEHRVSVAAPASRADREALAALAASLIRSVAVPTVELPPVAPRPRPAPERVVVPEPVVLVEPEPEVVVVAPEPVVVVEPEPVVVVAPEPEPVAVAPVPVVQPPVEAVVERPPSVTRWWVGGGPIFRMRQSVRSTVAAGVWAGPVRGTWRAGAGVEFTAPAVLRQVDPETRMTVADLRALGAWAPGSWELGASAALSVRVLTLGDQPAVIPTAGLLVARRIPAGALAVRFALLVERDLLYFDIDVGGFEPGEHRPNPLSAGLGISIWTRDPDP